MDYIMPEMDGAATLRLLKKQENGLCRETPVIVLTGDTLLQRNGVYNEMGFDYYLEKPIKGEMLESTILNYLPDDVVEYKLQKTAMTSNLTSNIETQSKRKQKRVVITTDCTCDLSDSLLERYDIGQMYLYVNLGNGRFKDTNVIVSAMLSKRDD